MLKRKLISAVLAVTFVMGASVAGVSADIAEAPAEENLSSVFLPAMEKYLVSDVETMKLIGYRECGEGLYEAWSYLVCDEDGIYPGCCGGFEGSVSVPERRISNSVLGFGFTYVPSRICGAVRSVIGYDGETVRIRVFEKANADEIPTEGLTVSDIKDRVELHHIYMDVDTETFPEGAEVYGSNPGGYVSVTADGKIIPAAKYLIYAYVGEEQVEPIKPVTVAFPMLGANENVALYRETEMGRYEMIELTVDEEAGTVSAELDRVNSKFYLTGVSLEYGDVNADGMVNLMDVAAILQHIAGWETDIIASAADVNRDGRTNLQDAGRLMNYYPSSPAPDA